MLLAVDPGLRSCGVALFNNNNQLHRAALVRSIVKKEQGPEAWRAMVGAVIEWCAWRDVSVIVERPSAYGSDRPYRTLDLQNLIAVGAMIIAAFPYGQAYTPFPRDWKGTVAPEVICARVCERLTAEERSRIAFPAKTLQHNVLDAIGLGLWHLGRFDRQRIFSKGVDK